MIMRAKHCRFVVIKTHVFFVRMGHTHYHFIEGLLIFIYIYIYIYIQYINSKPVRAGFPFTNQDFILYLTKLMGFVSTLLRKDHLSFTVQVTSGNFQVLC